MNENNHENYGCYEVKINRWFYFLQEKNIFWMLSIPLFPLAVLLLCLLNIVHLAYFVMAAIISALLLLAKIHSYPRYFDVTPSSIKICYRDMFLYILLNLNRLQNVATQNKEYTLYNIKSIERTQTPFERRMHVGRIHILGDSISTETENAEVTEKSLTIYGVKDFDNTYEWLTEFVNIENN